MAAIRTNINNIGLIIIMPIADGCHYQIFTCCIDLIIYNYVVQVS